MRKVIIFGALALIVFSCAQGGNNAEDSTVPATNHNAAGAPQGADAGKSEGSGLGNGTGAGNNTGGATGPGSSGSGGIGGGSNTGSGGSAAMSGGTDSTGKTVADSSRR